MNVKTTIVARDLERHFGRTRALDRVDLDIGSGITGLLGPNGAGKTTLLRVLATVLAADRGHLTVLGRDPGDVHQRVEIRRRLGYLPQDPGFHRGFTAFEFVDYVAILKEMGERGRRHREVRRVLDLVGLGDVAGKRIRALSGGMRQRLALAQALLGDPELLILDEPTVGLDPEQRLRFREVVSALGTGRTVLLSTHQTEDVAALCERVVVIDRGQVRFDGRPADLAALAAGRVWVDDGNGPRGRRTWRTGDGLHRHVGDPPAGAELVTPTIDDGYLLLVGEQADLEVAA